MFDNFESMRRGRAFKKGMCKFWPTPECLYPAFTVVAGGPNVCPANCPARHCLANLCIDNVNVSFMMSMILCSVSPCPLGTNWGFELGWTGFGLGLRGLGPEIDNYL